MENSDVKKAFEEIAEKWGMSIEEVRHEIELAIFVGQDNPDPVMQAL